MSVVAVRGVPEDVLVPVVEGIHARPGEPQPHLQLAHVARKSGVPPGAARDTLVTGTDHVPGGGSDVGMLGGVVHQLQGTRSDACGT
jgi:hypothetical protein